MNRSYAESIMRPSAHILQTKYDMPYEGMLRYVIKEVDEGRGIDHRVYNTEGLAVVNKERRNSMSVNIPNNPDEAFYAYNAAVSYAYTHFDMRDDDCVMLTDSQLYVNPPGSGLTLHADDHVLSADGTKYIGEDMYRSITLIVYLNDDFEGGELVFPTQDTTIKPAPGSMVIFPGNKHFMHRVMPITSGNRYAYQRMFGIMNGKTGKYTV